MKNITLIFFIIIISNSFVSQQFDSPPIEWRSVDWAMRDINGNNVFDPETTGEDWWYKHINVYDQGKHIGYLAVGYATWVLTPDNLSDYNNFYSAGCYQTDASQVIAAENPDLGQLEEVGHYKGGVKGLAAFYDLKGKIKWCFPYTIGDLQDAVQVNGGFVVVGVNFTSESLRSSNSLPYNKTPGNPADYFDNCIDFDNDSEIDNLNSKLYMMKIDMDGNVIWEGIYGTVDYSDYNEAYEARSTGYGIAKVDGGVVAVGETREVQTFLGADNLTQSSYLVKVDDNGNKVSERVIPADYAGFKTSLDYGTTYQVNSIATGIKSKSDTELLLYGLNVEVFQGALPPNTVNFQNHHRGYIRAIDENLNDVVSWGTNPVFLESYDQVNKNSKIWDGGYHSGNDEYLVPVIQDCEFCLFAGQNEGQFYLKRYNATTGSYMGETLLGTHTAYDMRAQAIETADGNIAVLGSTKDPNYANDNSGLYLAPSANYDVDFANGHIPQFFDNNKDYYKTWDTDALVTKLDPLGNIIWQKRFDSEAEPRLREPFPGDLKRQECMYAITEDEFGGLIVSGNTSHNFDDMYLAKITSDCQLSAFINAGGDDVYVAPLIINNGGTTTWTQDRRVFQKIIVDGSSTLIIDGAELQFADYTELNERYDLSQNSSSLMVPTIVVYPGSKLVIKNNALLRGLDECGRDWNWLGIQVIGDPNSSDDFTSQGVVQVESSTIQNAYVGILANASDFNADGVHTTDTEQGGGGIVQVDNSVFKNCTRGVHFTSYPWSQGNSTSKSYIQDSEFIQDEGIPNRYEDNVPSNTMLSIWDYHGIKILGNNFTFDDSNPRLDLFWNKRPRGIVVWDAAFEVSRYCSSGVVDVNGNCVGGSYQGNIFSNLKKGVEVNGIVGGEAIEIRYNTFNDNRFGVTVEGESYAKITNNIFNVSERQITSGNATELGKHYGVYATSASAIGVENNDFYNVNGFNTTSPFTRNIGVFSENSNFVGSGGSIRLNDFNNIGIGSQFAGNNGNMIADCNDYSNTGANADFDWAVSSGDLENQGNVGLPASNEFRNSCSSVEQIFHYNSGIVSSLIYSSKITDLPSCVSAPYVSTNVLTTSNTNGCPTDISDGGPATEIWVVELENQKIIRNELEDLISQGNNVELYESIDLDQAHIVRDKLKSKSPYLSDDLLVYLVQSNQPDWVVDQILKSNEPLSDNVLSSLITSVRPEYVLKKAFGASVPVGEEVLSELAESNREGWLVKQILKENSPLYDETLIAFVENLNYSNSELKTVLLKNTPLNTDVQTALDHRGVPNWLQNQVNNSNFVAADPGTLPLGVDSYEILTPMEKLNNEIQVVESRRVKALNYAVSGYIKDEQIEHAIALLEDEGTIEAKCMLVPIESKRDISKALDHIDEIRQEAILVTDLKKKEEMNSFCDLFEKYIEIKTQKGSLFNMSEQQKLFIENLSEEDVTIAVQAKNILKLVDGGDFDLLGEDLIEDGIVKSAYIGNEGNEEIVEDEIVSFRVYPNPSEDLFNISAGDDRLYTVSVYDLMGRLSTVSEFASTLTLDMSSMAEGVYIYTIRDMNGSVVGNGKVVVKR